MSASATLCTAEYTHQQHEEHQAPDAGLLDMGSTMQQANGAPPTRDTGCEPNRHQTCTEHEPNMHEICVHRKSHPAMHCAPDTLCRAPDILVPLSTRQLCIGSGILQPQCAPAPPRTSGVVYRPSLTPKQQPAVSNKQISNANQKQPRLRRCCHGKVMFASKCWTAVTVNRAAGSRTIACTGRCCHGATRASLRAMKRAANVRHGVS